MQRVLAENKTEDFQMYKLFVIKSCEQHYVVLLKQQNMQKKPKKNQIVIPFQCQNLDTYGTDFQ